MFKWFGKFQFWLLTLAIIIVISVIGRSLQLYVMKIISPMGVAVFVFLLLFLLILFLWKRRINFQLSRWAIFFAFFMLTTACVAVYLKILAPVEAVHFLIFSWFGWITSAVFGPIYGAIVVLSIAVGDEVLQHYLPNRVGDIHDVIVNIISGYTGFILRNKC